MFVCILKQGINIISNFIPLELSMMKLNFLSLYWCKPNADYSGIFYLGIEAVHFGKCGPLHLV